MSANQVRASQRRSAGYTLVELIIVIALLGIAGSLLIPQLVGRDILRAESAVRQMISDLSFAQSDALAHQELRRVYFYPDGRGYCIIRVTSADFDDDFDAATADYIQDPLASAGNLGSYIVDYSRDGRWEGMSISAIALDADDNNWITYDELAGTVQSAGGAPGVGGTITLRYEDADQAVSYDITVSAFTGKLTVSKN